MPISAGTRLGSYEILGAIGAGGMGEVYQARDARLHRTVALKFLPFGADQDPEARRRLLAEARAAAALDHPFICKIYEVDEFEQVSFIAMEYVAGETLRARIARGALPLARALPIAIEAAEALGAAHRGGVIHRDFKPSNVMIATDGHVKILDFGLAARLPPEVADFETATKTSPATNPSVLKGTLAYMSPEQLRGQQIDARSDVFAFGIVLYEMLTATHPFPGRTTFETASAILHSEQPPWSASVALPVLLQHVVRKALAKDPADRYQSMHDVLTDLRAVSADSKSASPHSAAVEDAVREAAVARSRWTRTVIAGLALPLVGVVGLTWWATRDPETAPVPSGHRQITFAGNVVAAALSPDGRTVAYVTNDRDGDRLMTQDLAGGPSLEIARSVYVDRLRWLPDGGQITARTSEGPIAVARLGGPVRRLDKEAEHRAFSRDGTRMAGARETGRAINVFSAAGQQSAQIPLLSARIIADIDWHASSDRLAILGSDDDGRWGVWTVFAEGHDARRVFASADPLDSVRWSPATDVIYTLSRDQNGARLVALDVPTRGEASSRVLLTGLPLGGGLSISADGSSLLHVRSHTSANLMLIDVAQPKEPPRTLTRGTRAFGRPRFSPDRQWIAVSVGSGSLSIGSGARSRIARVPLLGGEPIYLTADGGIDVNPVWSPDGSRIAHGSERDGTYSLWIITPDGNNAQKIDASGLTGNLLAAWTPDGQIAWQQTTTGNHFDFRIRDLNDGQESYLTSEQTAGWVFEPIFSPRGDRVAVYWNRPPERGLWLLTWPDRKSRRLGDHLGPLGWSPDGQSIYAAWRADPRPDVWIVSAATGQARIFATVPSGVITGGDVSSDGKHIVLSVEERKGDAWLIEHFDPKVR